jgi:predicted GTPase
MSPRVPVTAVSAVCTGCGKSQTARYLLRLLRERRLRKASNPKGGTPTSFR